MNPALLTDGYKTGHYWQYPEKTTLVYSNFTPRSNKYANPGSDQVISFGQQMVMRKIHEHFKRDFFDRSKDEVCKEVKENIPLYENLDSAIAAIKSKFYAMRAFKFSRP